LAACRTVTVTRIRPLRAWTFPIDAIERKNQNEPTLR
jgi:hypothetical protein